jgi:hypothetical protein
VKPACMTDPEYALWSEANTTLTSKAPTPCFDCPVSFSLAMKAVGRCDFKPGVIRNRPRLSDRVVAYRGRGSRYASEEDRIAARRQQWREYDARRKATA